MTVPSPKDTLYGVTYVVRRKCNKCSSTDWNEVKAGFIECKECGNVEEV